MGKKITEIFNDLDEPEFHSIRFKSESFEFEIIIKAKTISETKINGLELFQKLDWEKIINQSEIKPYFYVSKKIMKEIWLDLVRS